MHYIHDGELNYCQYVTLEQDYLYLKRLASYSAFVSLTEGKKRFYEMKLQFSLIIPANSSAIPVMIVN